MEDGVAVVGPNAGEMAEAGEAGRGRMAEPLEIVAAALPLLANAGGDRALEGRRVLVTSGPTHEPIDPVRYIANRSSGKQGHAIAAAAAAAGADVTLVSGPVHVPDPAGVRDDQGRDRAGHARRRDRGLARRRGGIRGRGRGLAGGANRSASKIKKQTGGSPRLGLVENPDILATVANRRSPARGS